MRYGIKSINRALEGIAGPTAIHLCFGYANAVRDKPNAYSFLGPLADSAVDQISIEAAQPKLDLGQLGDIAKKIVVIGVLDLSTRTVETPELVAERIRAALAHVPAERLMPAPDCGMKYVPRAVAFAKLKALADGAALVRRALR
jgi:5-methyltetrahydropteroyltriglutamate--homocysteine methyltransferase